MSGFGGEKIITNWMTVGYGCSDRGPLGLQIDIRMYIDGEVPNVPVCFDVLLYYFSPHKLGSVLGFSFQSTHLRCTMIFFSVCHGGAVEIVVESQVQSPMAKGGYVHN